MVSAKDIRVAPISRADADRVVKRIHYSGKVVNNSQLHFGVFLEGRLEGAMQFGPSLDKRKTQGLVRETGWNGFIELNRMAFGEALPRNSESRALAVAFRIMRKAYPHIEWCISFADGAQCGDGTIYRAAGFLLTSIKKNNQIWELPDGFKFASSTVTMLGPKGGELVREEVRRRVSRTTMTKAGNILHDGAASMRSIQNAGGRPIPGFQLRYVYFLNPAARERLTVPVLPFGKIEEMGAGMYRGEKLSRAKGQDVGNPPTLGGSTPTRTLHSKVAAA